MAELGRAALVLTLGLSAYALVAGGYAAWRGRRRLAHSARNALIASFFSTLVAALVLVVGFLTVCPVAMLALGSFSEGLTAFGAFTLDKYVAAYTDPALLTVLVNTAVFVLGSSVLATVLALFLAYLNTRTDVIDRLIEDGISLAGSHKRLAELYDAKGNREKAMSHYSSFIDLWKNADADLQPHVQKAKERLAQLQRVER